MTITKTKEKTTKKNFVTIAGQVSECQNVISNGCRWEDMVKLRVNHSLIHKIFLTSPTDGTRLSRDAN